MSLLHNRPQLMAKDEEFKGFVHSLESRYNLPHNTTMDKIAVLDEELVTQEIIRRLQKVKKEVGSPFLSIQCDLWSTLNAHEAYGAVNGSFVENLAVDDDDLELALSQILLAFDVFPDIEHTGNQCHCCVCALFSDLCR